jgi:hypothetical protein
MEFTVEGEVVIDEEAGTASVENDSGESIVVDQDGMITITNSDGTLTIGPDGYLASDGEGGYIFGNDEGYVAGNEGGLSVGNYDGDEFTVEGDVELDEEGNALVMDEDGNFIAVGPDGIIAGNVEEGIFAANEDLYFLSSDESVEVGSALGVFKVEGDVQIKEDGSVYVENDKGESISYDSNTASLAFSNDEGSMMITMGDSSNLANYNIQFMSNDGGCATVGQILCSLGNELTFLCSLYKDMDKIDDKSVTHTLFAPTDAAFANVEGPLSMLSEEEINMIFSFQRVEGAMMYDNLECKEKMEMVGGGLSRTACRKTEDGKRYKVQKGEGNYNNNNEPIIVISDIEACNGSIIHIVNEVLLPNSVDTFE